MHLSQHDLYTGLIAVGIIALALLCIELLVKKQWLNKLLGRKFLHLTAICTCAWAINHFENRLLLAYTFLLFFFILLWVIRKGWMQVNEYKTYGIALFPLAFALLLFIPAVSNSIIVYAVLILGISDALAGITGEKFGKQKIVFLSETKSWAGFAAFFISAFIISLFYFNNFSMHGILLCLALAILPAITELFSYRGSDNLTVPLLTASWVMLILNFNNFQLLQLLVSILFFAALSIYVVYKKWLTISGAVAACWMALLLYATGGYKAFIAPGIFLVSGSLLSKLNKPATEKDGRNAIQVFANGIIGMLFMILYGITQQDIFLITAIVSFVISMSDSTSSETGVYIKGVTYDILSFKKMEPGLSGGISLPGTLAGLAGGFFLSYITGYFYQFTLPEIFWITAAGFTGMMLDSILGSWLQVKYKTKQGVIIENKVQESEIFKGLSWCNNDMVNFISNLLITLLFWFIFNGFI